mmetsp:Transcript_104514/g.305120  ORF Transcript_104514/g.305120 Transcript_104514/m.305120 type:complete len:202 (+) Transcript_104514:344-949(+)
MQAALYRQGLQDLSRVLERRQHRCNRLCLKPLVLTRSILSRRVQDPLLPQGLHGFACFQQAGGLLGARIGGWNIGVEAHLVSAHGPSTMPVISGEGGPECGDWSHEEPPRAVLHVLEALDEPARRALQPALHNTKDPAFFGSCIAALYRLRHEADSCLRVAGAHVFPCLRDATHDTPWLRKSPSHAIVVTHEAALIKHLFG